MAQGTLWVGNPPALLINGTPAILLEYTAQVHDYSGVTDYSIRMKGWVNQGDIIEFLGKKWSGIVVSYTASDNVAEVALTRIKEVG
jgi:hypothetical protein